NEWQQQWPPLNAAETAIDGQPAAPERPDAIEIVLQLNDWGDIRRLYPIK
ncbi:MAG: hypothetical protein KAI15_00970, partial [Gammaproteobacteria bacterium]|nr:hypothetical protein [Gammaproteobacteria bacterium]